MFLGKNSNRNRQDIGGDDTFCLECDLCNKSLLCVTCGDIYCGRNDLGHALDHFSHTGHAITLDCSCLQIYCYKCDDDVDIPFEHDKLDLIVNNVRDLFGLNFDEVPYIDSETHDLETEEENESNVRPSPDRFYMNDDESVPEEESSPMKVCFANDLSGPIYPDVTPKKASRKKSKKALRRSKNQRSQPYSEPRDGSLTVLNVDPKLAAPRRRGLKNLGNTCYMNSVIQALNVTPVLHKYLTQLPILEPDDLERLSPHIERPRYATRKAVADSAKVVNHKRSVRVLAEEMRKVMLELSEGKYTEPYSPGYFREAVICHRPYFNGFRQHDAHEFLRVILEQMHLELKKCRIPEKMEKWLIEESGTAPVVAGFTVISRLFEGALQSTVECLQCRNSSVKHDPFMDLSLDINTFEHGRAIRVQDCMRQFFSKEVLDQRDLYTCAHCMQKQPSTKQMSITNLPPVICLHLKRFGASGNKLDSMIDYPMRGLNMKEYMTPSAEITGSTIYDLTAIIVHSGVSTMNGHYFSYGRSGNNWYLFNDQQVKGVTEQTVEKQKAYILMYTKRTAPPQIHMDIVQPPILA